MAWANGILLRDMAVIQGWHFYLSIYKALKPAKAGYILIDPI